MARHRPTLRLVQILHRHGDRSPLYNVYEGIDGLSKKENEFWISKLNDTGSSSSEIYGELTTKGIDQMKSRGKKLRKYCIDKGWSMEKMDMRIYSTHYTRTQQSVNALVTQFTQNSSKLPDIKVLPIEKDFINAYNMNGPSIMKLKDTLVDSIGILADREAEMASIKTELLRLLPMFQSERVKFTWMNAADYFVCRQAHQLPLLPMTESIADDTIQHLSFRFQQFYSHKPILHHVAGHLLNQLLAEIQKNIAQVNPTECVRIYSGHDVSVLALLYALKPPSLTWTYWPDYSAAVTIELYENNKNDWFIGATLDGEPLFQDLIALNDFKSTIQNTIEK